MIPKIIHYCWFGHGEMPELAKTELAKVDWSRQPAKYRKLYRMPLWYLKVENQLKNQGAKLKQFVRKHVK